MPSENVKYKIQKRVGFSMVVGLLIASIVSLIVRVTIRHLTIREVLFSEYVLLILLFTIPASISIFINSKFIRAVQVSIFFILGILGIILNVDEPISLIEVYFFVCGIILSLQYGFFKKHFVLKAVLFFVIFSFLKLGLGYLLNKATFLLGVFPILLSLVFFYIIWIAFAEEINNYIKETKELKQQIDQDQVFVTFGKNVGGVTHNLKNKIMAIQSFNELIAEHKDDEIHNYCMLQKDVIDESFRLINNLTMAIKAKQDPEQKIIKLNRIINSVVDLFDSNAQFHQEVSVKLKLGKEAHIFMSPLDASQLIENLLRNSWEAKGDRELLEVRIQSERRNDHIVFSIEDDGIGIPHCESCHLHNDCNNCKHFKIGKTTKTGGSGIGMVFIMDILNKYNGRIKINSKTNAGTKIQITFKAEEIKREYFRD